MDARRQPAVGFGSLSIETLSRRRKKLIQTFEVQRAAVIDDETVDVHLLQSGEKSFRQPRRHCWGEELHAPAPSALSALRSSFPACICLETVSWIIASVTPASSPTRS